VAAALARIARETGAGILLVEHKTDVLAQIADEVVVLERGRWRSRARRPRCWPIRGWWSWESEPPAGVRLERAVRASGLEWSAVRASGLEWSAALAEAIE